MIDFLTQTATSFYALVPITLAQSLILSFVVLGIMIPFRILGFPDLTSEGAFPLGGAVSAALISMGMPVVPAILCAIIAGFIAGCSTAFIHLRFKIHTLLAGILVMTMLYSINLRIMGRSNLSIFGVTSIFEQISFLPPNSPTAKIFLTGLFVLFTLLLLNLFFRTESGIAVRAVGSNQDMAEAQGINVWLAIIGSVGLAGACSAFSGALMVQSQSFADVNMGLGILINGLAALMIGEGILGRDSLSRQLLAPFLGAIIYYQLVSICLAAGMPPPDLKLATGLFVLTMLALPNLRRGGGPVVQDKATRE